jgi:hypothetical protein
MPLSCSTCLTVASLVPSRNLTADDLAWCLFLTGLLGRTRACFTHASIVFSGILLRTFTALMPLTTALASRTPAGEDNIHTTLDSIYLDARDGDVSMTGSDRSTVWLAELHRPAVDLSVTPETGFCADAWSYRDRHPASYRLWLGKRGSCTRAGVEDLRE